MHALLIAGALLAAAPAILAQAAPPQPPPQPPSSTGPRVSPDGRLIAFSSFRNQSRGIYAMRPDGSELRSVSGAVPDGKLAGWTADGRVVLSLETADSSTLFAVTIDGRQAPIQIGRVPGRSAALSPDGNRVATVIGPWASAQIVVGGLNGGTTTLLTAGRTSAYNAAWSPDGKQIAYSGTDSTRQIAVWVVNVDGTDARRLTAFPRGERAQVPGWSPEGRRVAFQVGAPVPSDPTKRLAHVYVIDLRSEALTKLAPHDSPHLDEVPVWFPDGRRIAFQSDRSGTLEIWVMDADGRGAVQLTTSKH